jgi:hypothetical protein
MPLEPSPLTLNLNTVSWITKVTNGFRNDEAPSATNSRVGEEFSPLSTVPI